MRLTTALGRGMSVKGMELATTFRPTANTVYGWLPQEPFSGAWQQNVQCAPAHELTAFSAVYACVARIANDVAKLLLRLMQREQSGIWVEAPRNNPYWIPLLKPNQLQNRIQFFVQWLVSKLLHGNVYVLKLRDGRGMVQRLFILDPRRVSPMVTSEGDVYYSLAGDVLHRIEPGMVAPAGEIIHDRGPTLWHPLVGVSPVAASALSVTQGLRIQQNSQRFFENMSRPSGVLTGPNVIDEPTAKRFKEAWEDNFRGGKIGRLAVLGNGLSYEAMSMPADESQLIEQLKWTVEDTARAFSMPLYKIGAGTMPTSNNVAALNQQYYDDCLQVYIEAIELCLQEGLGVPDGLAVEFDLEGLLRMDKPAQVEMLHKASGGAFMTPNESRAKANLPPVDGGNALYKQQQDHSLSALAKRDESDDPFGKSSPAPAPSPPAAEPTDEPEKAIGVIVERALSSDALRATLAACVGTELVAQEQRAAAERAAAAEALEVERRNAESARVAAETAADEEASELAAALLERAKAFDDVAAA